MIPGVNPAQAKQLMKKMGITQDDIEVLRIEMVLPDRTLIFDSPEVAVVNMQGQKTFQVSGAFTEKQSESTLVISDEDIATVTQQTNCDAAKAKEVLEKHEGDLAAAIIELSE